MIFSKTLRAHWWKAPIPKGWRAYFDEIATFEPERTGDSALQIGCGRRSVGLVEDHELQSQLALFCKKPRMPPAAVSFGKLTGYTCEETKDDGIYWRYWLLKQGPLLFRVTYNCERDLEGRDAAVCEQVLNSIVITDR